MPKEILQVGIMLSMEIPGNLLSLPHPMLTVPYLILQTLPKALKTLFLRKWFTLLKEISIVFITSLKF